MRTEQGITIIEVVVAIILLGLLTVLTLPQLQRYAAGRDLRHVARYLSGDIRLTQQYAVTQHENFRLVYAAAPASGYTIRRVSDNAVIKEAELPETVAVTGAFASTPVEFSSTGAPAQAGAFCLGDGSGLLKVDVQPATGRVQISEVTSCP